MKTSTDFQQSSLPDIAQNSLLVQSVQDTLKRSDIQNDEDLEKLFGTYPISSSDGTFRATVTFAPLFDRVNINAYYMNQNIDRAIDRFLDNILSYYEIADPIFFKDLILDTIDEDLSEREGYSEIKEEDPSFANGKIYSYIHFQKILDYYYKKREDPSIYKIPWNSLIYFGEKKRFMIDCNFIEKNVVKFLALKYDGTLNCTKLAKYPANESIMKEMDIEPYKKGIDFWLLVNIEYNKAKQRERLIMTYNLNNKKVVKIESHPLY